MMLSLGWIKNIWKCKKYPYRRNLKFMLKHSNMVNPVIKAMILRDFDYYYYQPELPHSRDYFITRSVDLNGFVHIPILDFEEKCCWRHEETDKNNFSVVVDAINLASQRLKKQLLDKQEGVLLSVDKDDRPIVDKCLFIPVTDDISFEYYMKEDNDYVKLKIRAGFCIQTVRRIYTTEIHYE